MENRRRSLRQQMELPAHMRCHRWQAYCHKGSFEFRHYVLQLQRIFSLILLGVVDADYKFLWYDVGGNCSASDAGIFNASDLHPALENNTLGFPDPERLHGGDRDVPYFLVGDDAFPLREWLMKPFSTRKLNRDERVFNYRLSRARRVVENALGFLRTGSAAALPLDNTPGASTCS